ncbi:MAG: TlpA disulfide reductase family protein [Bacteriovoracaceae bacterium]|nr:TlpA disulfide reductase family protein [Bacteriovoracaceae bacterium]
MTKMKRFVNLFTYLISMIFLMIVSIDGSWGSKNMVSEYWRIQMDLQGNQLPFILEHKKNQWWLHNQTERILLKTIENKSQRLKLEFPQYSNTLELIFTDLPATKVSGKWIKQALPSALEFSLQGELVNKAERFKESGKKFSSTKPLRLKMDFLDEGEKSQALGIFSYPSESKIYGSILTETGDYRYLEGIKIDDDHFLLVGFDGQFAFYIASQIDKTGAWSGTLFGGKKWVATFSAREDEKFQLSDPYSLTKLMPEQKRFHFKGTDLDGHEVDLSLLKRKSPNTIVQVMGSWCPNCLDESVFLQDWLKKQKPGDFEVIALAFEKSPDVATAKIRLNKWRKQLGITYPVVLAAHNLSEKKVTDILPEIEKHVSFPTLYFLGQNGEVKKIHTGFAGPATGEEFLKLKEHL